MKYSIINTATSLNNNVNTYTLLKPSKTLPDIQCIMAEGMNKTDAEHLLMCLNLYESVKQEEQLVTK